MLKQKNTIIRTLATTVLALVAVACGSKIAGTYSSSVSGSSSYIASICSGMQLTVNDLGNNQVSINGGNGQCTLSVTGLNNNGVVVPSTASLTLSSYGSCQFTTGSINISNNVISGSLTSTTAGYGTYPTTSYGYYGSSNTGMCGTTLTLNGSKTN